MACDDLRMRTMSSHERDRPRMVGLHMTRYNVIYLGRIDNRAYSLKQFFLEWLLYGIYKSNLIIDDKVCIVARATRRSISVECAHRPVDRADPVNAISDLDCFHITTSFLEYVL